MGDDASLQSRAAHLVTHRYVASVQHPSEPFLPTAGGLPIGAVLVKQKIADVMAPGDHGSTFAGNPLVCHAANAVVDIIAEPSFLEGVTQKGERLRQGLRQALGSNPHVKEVRGLGLIVGVQLDTVSQRVALVTGVYLPAETPLLWRGLPC